jgi:hypothetical protein
LWLVITVKKTRWRRRFYGICHHGVVEPVAFGSQRTRDEPETEKK